MRRVRWLVVGTSWVVPAWGAGDEAAEERGATELRWVNEAGAESCTAEDELKEAVRRRLGRDPFTGESGQWLEGSVRREPEGYVARIVERDGEGRTLGVRTLRASGESCRELDPGVVLALTLLIDPDAALAASEPDTAPAGTAPPNAPCPAGAAAVGAAGAPGAASSAAAKPSSTTPGAAAPSPHPTQIAATLGVLLTGGWVPRPAPGVQVGTSLWPSPRLGLELAGLHVPEQRTVAEDVSLGFTLSALFAGVCARSGDRSARWLAVGCLSLAAGGITAIVYDPSPAEPGERFWGALRTTGGLEARVLGPLHLRASGLVAVPFVRWKFQVRGEDPIFQQAMVLPGGEVTAVLLLP